MTDAGMSSLITPWGSIERGADRTGHYIIHEGRKIWASWPTISPAELREQAEALDERADRAVMDAARLRAIAHHMDLMAAQEAVEVAERRRDRAAARKAARPAWMS